MLQRLRFPAKNWRNQREAQEPLRGWHGNRENYLAATNQQFRAFGIKRGRFIRICYGSVNRRSGLKRPPVQRNQRTRKLRSQIAALRLVIAPVVPRRTKLTVANR